MKYLDEISTTLEGIGSVHFNSVDQCYEVTLHSENVLFQEQLFDQLLQEHDVTPSQIIEDVQRMLLENTNGEHGEKHDE